MPSLGLRLALVITVCSSALPLRAQSVDETLDRASKAWSRVKTARASFEQTVTNSLTGSTAKARGEFQQQRPGKLAIRFTEPAGDRIISDGRWVWIYLPSSAPGQVVKRPAADAGAVPADLTAELLEEPRKKYEIRDAGADTVAGHRAHAVTLVPKPGPQSAFTKATVWVDDDDGLVRRFEVVEPSGITRQVRITNLEINVAVDRDAFNFVAPKGAKIVER